MKCSCGNTEARLQAGITVAGKRWWVQCPKCGLRGEMRNSRAGARKAWTEQAAAKPANPGKAAK